jgi:hypothetical protein
MKTFNLYIALLFVVNFAQAQNIGIVRKNDFSSYYDSTLLMTIENLDSSTVRLGSINTTTGVVSNIGNDEYSIPINLTGATIDPYLNRYYIGSGTNFATFDINSGSLINNVQISGASSSFNFQNFRFNHSDSTIYGMVPINYYSLYFDSSSMSVIEVLDSAQIRFASLNPTTGRYTLKGNTSYSNLYTLAGNSIDPYQMVYYYSAVDTLIGIDLYTGNQFSAAPISLPSFGIFENIAYSCVDKSIYGLTRQLYLSSQFDSILMDYVDVVDSTTFRLSKINPATGVITFISPYNIGAGSNLTGGAFIDPSSMSYFFNNGNQIVGVSLVTGLITSSVPKTFDSDAFAIDMMRNSENCYNATAERLVGQPGGNGNTDLKSDGILYPNPARNEITLKINAPFSNIEILDSRGSLVLISKQKTIDISRLSSGVYFAKVISGNGLIFTRKFIKY